MADDQKGDGRGLRAGKRLSETEGFVPIERNVPQREGRIAG